MARFLCSTTGYSPRTGGLGDRGCPACETQADHTDPQQVFVVDIRGRYWCLECALAALGNVRRKQDERPIADDRELYPWQFPDKADSTA